jgi:hypothetical protein
MLMEKHWKFAFSSLEMANHMQKKCSRDHDHIKIESNRTGPSAGYPRQLCDRFATMFLKVPTASSLAIMTIQVSGHAFENETEGVEIPKGDHGEGERISSTTSTQTPQEPRTSQRACAAKVADQKRNATMGCKVGFDAGM